MTSKIQMVRSSMVVGFFTLLGSLTGILVETTIAAHLGLSKSSDTFYVAYTVPYIITNLVGATGQFSLVPFFSVLDTRHSTEELWRGFSYVLNVILIGSGSVALVGVALSPWIVHGIAPGFAPGQTLLASKLARLLFLVVIPACVGEVFRSFLFSQHRFALSSAAFFFRNASVIACVLLGFRRFGMYSIVIGYGVGCLLLLTVLAAQTLACFKVRYYPTLAGSGEVFQNLRGSGKAQVLAAVGWQGVVIVERIIASFLAPGTLTALNYGFKIVSTIGEVLAGSVGTASLPALSRAVARDDVEEERRTFDHTLEICLVLLCPMMVFCLTLPRSIIRLVFQHGLFTPEATLLMSHVFFYYSLSLLFFAGFRVFTFYLFARQEAGTFLRLSMLQYALTILFDIVYVGLLHTGAVGIPLGMLTALAVVWGFAYTRNSGQLRRALDRPFAVFSLKMLAGSVLTALVLEALRAAIPAPQKTFGNFLYLCELCGAGSLVFSLVVLSLRAFNLRDLALLWRRAEGS